MQEFDASTIRRRSAQGVVALTLRTFFLNLLSFGASLVVFTLLAPQEVGLYTAVLAMQKIVSFFTDFGLGAALVQKKESLVEADITTSFTIQSSLTLFIFLVAFVSQHALGSFFHLSSDAQRLFVVLVFCIFLSSFKTIPSILLERAIRFEKLVIPQMVESFVFNMLVVGLMLLGARLNSFSWAFLASSVIGIPFYYAVSPWRVRFGIDRESLHHLKFGIQFQAKNILATLKDDFLTVTLAKLLTFTEIGYIGFAQRWSFFSYRFIVDSITKVTFSAYARIQDDKERLRQAIEKSLFYTGTFMCPMLFGLIIMSPYLVRYFPKWHNKWEGALVSLVFFSLNALVSSFSGILVNVLDATGRVKTTLKLMVLWTVLIWILTPLLIFFYGYHGVSVASFLVTLTLFLTVYLVKKIIQFDFIKSVAKPFISSIVMSGIVYVFLQLLAGNLISFVLVVFLGGVVYVVLMYMIAGREVSEGIKMVIAKS